MDVNGKIFNIADIERPDQPYIILESISKEKKVSKGLIIIKTPLEEPIKMVSLGDFIFFREEGINVK